jgi:integrase
MMYGLRRSELAGLKWSAVDFQNDTLTIRHTVTQYKTRVAKDETKNKASHRTLPLNQSVKAFLIHLRAQQAQEKLLLGQAYQDTGYVCRFSDGRAWNVQYISQAFRRHLIKCILPNIRLHDLRHSCASYLLKAGCDFKEIQMWLGHKQISTTLDIYTHLDASSKKEAAKRLGALLSL